MKPTNDLTKLSSDSFGSDILRKALRCYQCDLNDQNIRPPHPIVSDPKYVEGFLKSLTDFPKPRHPIPWVLPCANVEPKPYHACENPGTMACSACKLVSYCSKDCQTTDWKRHKRECKNVLRSAKWRPSWAVEHRLPSFLVADSSQGKWADKEWQELSGGISLWGNIPAMDVINLANNEKDPTKDFSLAFIASGDLRHVVRTLNSLPPNYSGNIKILLNDRNSPIVCRNIIILLILGNIPDKTLAADIALHFWYSVFLPSEYRLALSKIVLSFVKRTYDEGFGSIVVPLGQNSSLTCTLTQSMCVMFGHFISSDSFSVGEIRDKYDRVRNAPTRGDFRDKMYAVLRPSHRVAFQQFRRSGILLPCGAAIAHFNVPNLSLFSIEGKWNETDYADPLQGWDVEEVVKVGKAHGANVEDIYGCLYFFLSEQLHGLADRLQSTSTSFFLQMLDACDLARNIRNRSLAADGIPARSRFDRIEVSNIIDANYVGLNGVLTEWGPLLSDNRAAALVGYFMNWYVLQKDGRATGAPDSVYAKLFGALLEKEKNASKLNSSDIETKIHTLSSFTNLLYDNSKPFSEFMKKQGINEILNKTNLTLRRTHAIVPPRIGVPLKGKYNALPQFPDDDSWYYNTQMTCSTWAERFVEFSRK